MRKEAHVITLFFILVVSLGNSTFAQEKLDNFMLQTTPEERAEMQTEFMKKNLSLTDKQIPLVREINQKYAKKMQTAYESSDRKLQRLKKLKVVSDEKDNQLKRVLSTIQYENYMNNKEAMKEKMKERAKQKRPL